MQSIGYTVFFYDAEDEDNLIHKYGLGVRAKIVHAFSVIDENLKIVYINNSLPTENKKYSILHETGHIVLGHLESDYGVVNDRLREMEAEVFAYEVLSYKRSHKFLLFAITVLITAGLTSPYFIQMHKTKVIDTSSSTITNDTVYITPAGNKYHRESCIHTKDKECIAITKEDAQKTHKPCSVCNP